MADAQVLLAIGLLGGTLTSFLISTGEVAWTLGALFPGKLLKFWVVCTLERVRRVSGWGTVDIFISLSIQSSN